MARMTEEEVVTQGVSVACVFPMRLSLKIAYFRLVLPERARYSSKIREFSPMVRFNVARCPPLTFPAP